MRQNRIACFLLKVAIAAPMCAGNAWGAPLELSEDELAAVSGQGIVTLANSSLNGLDFSKLTLNADVSFNANFQNIVLGQNSVATKSGSTGDINIPTLQFGVSNGTTAQQTVQITNPYFEFVYNNAGGAGNSQVVGMRFGFEGISGNLGTLMSTISGDLQIANGSTTLSANGAGSTSVCSSPTSCVPLSKIGGLIAGNASGPSRDFWISMLSQSVQFPTQTGLAAPGAAQAGVWINWTDRLAALNTSGLIPPNVAALMPRH